jgi:hypothetical protein
MEVLQMGFLDQPEKSQTIPLMQVRVGSLYVYSPNGWDTLRPTSNNTLHPGQVVRVIYLLGTPNANTMGQCYVGDRETGKFICMVSTASLESVSVFVARRKEQAMRCGLFSI